MLIAFLANFQLDTDYPSLIVLGLSQRVVSMLDKMKGKRITQLSHQTVRHVIIGTAFVTEKVAKEVCELSLQFPKASINWSSSLLCADNMAYLVEQMFRFSHVMPKGFIGILWTPKSIKYMEPIQSKYLVGEKGNEHTVKLVKYYSDAELMQLMTIYRGKNCFYFY
ncbi:Dnm1 dynamin-related GTPase [Candida orthopsilosis Co 90-125]|uniref:Dnm1 dynamin-related GTPase n=1 Tax=Candida orthopsilosis (strain 90-125) TaxID=1136231 RepID=H8X5S1_CANO9|nr:Dnm1 dynamin-related GTPase [Candida orthopsilosis Co 90-125]CCG23529.1 Dnm1 dynamin-related GTPase [Candida orthopsilosis Co 90-125]